MSVEQLLQLNEKYKENRPKASLIYLAECDYEFVKELADDIEIPLHCPTNLLKSALKSGYHSFLKYLPFQLLEYISESAKITEHNLGENLKLIKLLYDKDARMSLDAVQCNMFEDLLEFINTSQNNFEIIIDNLYYLYKLNGKKWDHLLERVLLLNKHDKEFFKEPLLSEIKCVDAEDLLVKLPNLTKERFAIIRQFDKKCDLNSVRPTYIWQISKTDWKNLNEVIENYELQLNLFRGLTVEQISKFIENFEQASQKLKELCKRDSLAITCIINDFKYEDFVLNSYMDDAKALRDTIVAYALANNKTRFLQLITNRSDLLHINRQATKLLMQEEVYTKCLDINTMHIEDFSLLSKWEFTDWPEFKDIDIMLNMEEFKAALGKPKQYVHFICESKRKGFVNVEAVEELYIDDLLSPSIAKAQALAQQLNGRKLSEIYNEVFLNTGIGFRTVIKLITKCGVARASEARSIWDAYIILDEFQENQIVFDFTMSSLLDERKNVLLQHPGIKEYQEKYTDKFDEMIQNGIVEIIDAFNTGNVDENVKIYLNHLIDEWYKNQLEDFIYSRENMLYELEYDLPMEVIEEWKYNSEITIDKFTVKEVASLEERMLLCHKINTRYSYKTDKSASLSIMDASKKLLAIYHQGDCIGVATLRLTKLGTNPAIDMSNKRELILYLSDVSFLSDIKYEIKINALKMIIRLALQKSCSMGCILALVKKYGDYNLGIDTQKTSSTIFNNKSRNPIQFFADNQYRGSWDSLKTYTQSTFLWLK